MSNLNAKESIKNKTMTKENLIYLNAAAVALVSKESVKAAQDFQEGTLTNPAKTFFQWKQNGLEELREKTAQLINAKTSEVAFIPNFSFGIAAVLDSIRPKVSKVLLYKDDYPSLTMPVELGGFDVYYVESKDGFSFEIDDIKSLVEKEGIEAVIVSHVQFLTGFTLDIEALGNYLQSKGVAFIVDTTQSTGAVEFDFQNSPIDVIISSSYKWLNGGLGSGILVIKDDFMEKYPPKIAGFGSVTQVPGGWTYKPSLLSYEPGHLNPLGLLQLFEGVKHHLEMGVSTIQKHNHSLIKRLAEGLKKTNFKVKGGNEGTHLSTILVFEAPQKVHEYLVQNKVVTTWRKNSIRVSPHYYNTEAEIDRLVELLVAY